jgi:hypothetical protein
MMSDDAFAELLHKDTSFQIIAAVYEVHNVLGFGFLCHLGSLTPKVRQCQILKTFQG